MLHHLPLLLTYALMLVLAREVWMRRRPPGRHRPNTASGMMGWQSHVGLPKGATSAIGPDIR